MRKYGTKWSLQNKEVREKGKQTWQETLGTTHPLKSQKIQEKKKQTCLNTLGVEHQFMLTDVQKKCKTTKVIKYGTEHVMQNAEISERQSKNAFRLKTYTFHCGNTIQVQGYEPLLLDILVKQGYTFEDIIDKSPIGCGIVCYTYNVESTTTRCSSSESFIVGGNKVLRMSTERFSNNLQSTAATRSSWCSL